MTPLVGLVAMLSMATAGVDPGRTMWPRSPQTHEDPSIYLEKSLKGTFQVNVVATMLQKRHRQDSGFDKIRLLRSQAGHQKWTVVEPLSRAGIESVDDGNRCQTYIPDAHQLIDLDSPSRDEIDSRKRLAIARQNYEFSLAPGENIAGRGILCVIAKPRWAELDTRRYFLDRTTFYPLRIEFDPPGGPRVTFYDTKDIYYPTKISREAFKLHPLEGARRIRYERPVGLSAKDAITKVGFEPLVPQHLPMGFHVQEMQYSGRSEWRSVVIRLTDGLVRANLYEWLQDGRTVRPMADSSSGMRKGIRFLLVSDNLGDSVRRKLLDTILGVSR